MAHIIRFKGVAKASNIDMYLINGLATNEMKDKISLEDILINEYFVNLCSDTGEKTLRVSRITFEIEYELGE